MRDAGHVPKPQQPPYEVVKVFARTPRRKFSHWEVHAPARTRRASRLIGTIQKTDKSSRPFDPVWNDPDGGYEALPGDYWNEDVAARALLQHDLRKRNERRKPAPEDDKNS